MSIPIEYGFTLVGLLWLIGLVGLLARKNALFMLMAMEIMLNAGALAFILAGSRWHEADGQILYIVTIAIAAAEVGLALALLLLMKRRVPTLNIDTLSELKG